MTDPRPIPALSYDPAAYLYARDSSHLNLLAIFHYVAGGLMAFFGLFPSIYIILGLVMVTGGFSKSGPQPPPPGLGWIFVIMGAVFMILLLAMSVLTIYSGRCIKRRRNWVFSLVIAGFMCLSVPIGTALGVFTFIVLLRDSVKRLYGVEAGPPPYPPPCY